MGPTGTGKSSIVTNYLHKLSPENYLLINLSFSARTSASQTQDIIMSKMNRLVQYEEYLFLKDVFQVFLIENRRKKGVYGPSGNKKGALFIDDLNMPLPEKYGAQPPIELLRNIADHGFLYEKYHIKILYS